MSEVIVIQGKNALENKSKLRVCAYARVSSSSCEQSMSFSNQVQYYTNHIKQNPNWEYVDIYADEAKTGTRSDKRDDFNRMLEDCKDGKIDIILTKSVSRFARNVSECVRIVKMLKDIGVSVRFEEEGVDSSNPADFQKISIWAAIAQEGSETIAQNVRMGARHRMKNGNYIQVNPPYGYSYEKQGFKINEEQAKIVKRIFEFYISGNSISKIANELENEDIPNKLGEIHWTPQSISYILKNVRYKGDALLQKTYKDGFPFKQNRNKGELEQYYIHNANEPIISAEIFDKVQDLLKKNREKYYKESENASNVFSQKIYCKNCGAVFREKNGAWSCRNHDKSGNKCAEKPIGDEEIKSAFVTMYNKLKANCDYILLPFITMAEEVKTNESEKKEISELNIKIAQTTEQILSINRLKEKGLIESAFCMEELNRLEKTILDFRRQKNKIYKSSKYEESIRMTKELIRLLQENKALGKFSEEIFSKMVKKIEISGNDIAFILKCGMNFEIKRREAVKCQTDIFHSDMKSKMQEL